jgi:uncharacterized protein (DUF2062 family)
MMAALLIAAIIGANVPCAVTFVWISNPLTWIPLYSPCYLLGAKILQIDPIPLSQITILKVGWHYVALWLGCLIVGTVLSISTHFILNVIWRLHIRRRWQHRRQMRMARKKQNR